MRRGSSVALLLLFSAGMVAQVAHPTPKDPDKWHITPGGTAGVITTEMTEVDLFRVFGRKNVTRGDVGLGEGQTVPGTILFAGDPIRRLEIIWSDNEHGSLAKQVQIFGTRRSHWETTSGISVGTTLKELERINGRPFRFGGFDVDYEGTVRSWDGGRLEKEFTANGVIIRLRPSKILHASVDEFRSISGEGEYTSSNFIIQKVNPEIYEIIWVLR